MENLNLVSSESGLPCESAPKNHWIFVWMYLLLGYGVVCVFTDFGYDSHFRRNIPLITAAYAAVVIFWLRKEKKRMAAESWFWLAVMGAVAIPYVFWSIMPVLQVLVLLVTTAYWTLSASGALIEQHETSQWILVDVWHAVADVPFRHIFCFWRELRGGVRRTRSGRRMAGMILGLGIAVPVLAVALPLLGRADAGFQILVRQGMDYFWRNCLGYFLRFLLSVPVAAYLFGLAYGGIVRKSTRHFHKDSASAVVMKLHAVPDVAVSTAVVAVCAAYLAFIGLQSSYLFSAFAGLRPENFTYAEYARQGFFELCQISLLNIAVLLGANSFSKTARRENKVLRWLNVLMSVLTLLLILTAASKMLLYISAYGFTVKRILTSVFMLWMAIVFVLNVVQQRRELPFVQYAVLSGAILFCALCVAPVGHLVSAAMP